MIKCDWNNHSRFVDKWLTITFWILDTVQLYTLYSQSKTLKSVIGSSGQSRVGYTTADNYKYETLHAKCISEN